MALISARKEVERMRRQLRLVISCLAVLAGCPPPKSESPRPPWANDERRARCLDVKVPLDGSHDAAFQRVKRGQSPREYLDDAGCAEFRTVSLCPADVHCIELFHASGVVTDIWEFGPGFERTMTDLNGDGAFEFDTTEYVSDDGGWLGEKGLLVDSTGLNWVHSRREPTGGKTVVRERWLDGGWVTTSQQREPLTACEARHFCDPSR